MLELPYDSWQGLERPLSLKRGPSSKQARFCKRLRKRLRIPQKRKGPNTKRWATNREGVKTRVADIRWRRHMIRMSIAKTFKESSGIMV